MAIWAETGERTPPIDANIEAGLVSGESIPRPWLNWVLWVLHTVYVTGIYYVAQIRPLVSGGTYYFKNFLGTVTYFTIDTDAGTTMADQGLLVGKNVARRSRLWFEDDVVVRVRNNNLVGHIFTSNGGVAETHRLYGNILNYLNPATHSIDVPLKLPYSTGDGGYNSAKPHYLFKSARLVSAIVTTVGASPADIISKNVPSASFTLKLIRSKNQVNSETYLRETELLTASGTYPATNTDLSLSTGYDVAVITDAGILLDFQNYSYSIRISVTLTTTEFVIFPDFYYELIQHSAGYLS